MHRINIRLLSSQTVFLYQARRQTELFLGDYHKYRVINERGETIKNPAFDRFSGAILDIKSDTPIQPKLLNAFANTLTKKIQGAAVGPIHFAAVVPSHFAKKHSANLLAILRESSRTLKFLVEPRLLNRTTTIAKLATGGDRSITTHLSTIAVGLPECVQDRTILVIDDVWTTGNSMMACAHLLYEKGAAAVITVALGKTVAA